jgi:hypothetical protein
VGALEIELYKIISRWQNYLRDRLVTKNNISCSGSFRDTNLHYKKKTCFNFNKKWTLKEKNGKI